MKLTKERGREQVGGELAGLRELAARLGISFDAFLRFAQLPSAEREELVERLLSYLSPSA